MLRANQLVAPVLELVPSSRPPWYVGRGRGVVRLFPGLHRSHRSKKTPGTGRFRLHLRRGVNGLLGYEPQPCRSWVGVVTPLTALLVGRIGRLRFEVVPTLPPKVTGGERIPVECFRSLRSGQRPRRRQSIRGVCASRRPARIERAMFPRAVDASSHVIAVSEERGASRPLCRTSATFHLPHENGRAQERHRVRLATTDSSSRNDRR
jgi:hypothetical protein